MHSLPYQLAYRPAPLPNNLFPCSGSPLRFHARDVNSQTFGSCFREPSFGLETRGPSETRTTFQLSETQATIIRTNPR